MPNIKSISDLKNYTAVVNEVSYGKILILEMFHEKEDFMRKLFGIVTTSQETIDYWDE